MQKTRERWFPHQRLDAYQVALELAEATVTLTRRMPRGFAEIGDQARRAALATVRHIAEGASRRSPADKRARYMIARGEVAEVDATIETAARLDLVPCRPARDLRQLANRVGAMLSGLIQAQDKRIERA